MDGYFLAEIEKLDHEKVLMNLDQQVVTLKPHAHYHVAGVSDVISAMYSSYRKILMCGWKNNKVLTIIFDQDKPELSRVISSRCKPCSPRLFPVRHFSELDHRSGRRLGPGHHQ